MSLFILLFMKKFILVIVLFYVVYVIYELISIFLSKKSSY